MNNSQQRKIGVILSYLTIFVNTIIQLLYTPFLIRALGQSEYGLYSLAFSIIGYLNILDLGFGNAIIVFTNKYRAKGKLEQEKKMHGMFRRIFTIMGIIIGLLSIILFFSVNNIFGRTMTDLEIEKMKIMMLILAFNLIITFCFNIYSSIISAYEKFIFQKVLTLLNTILKPLIMIPILLIGFKSIALCIVITIINTSIIVSNYIYCRKIMKIKIEYSGFDKEIFKTVFFYSIWIFLGVVVDKVNWSVDNFILGAISGTVAVAIYSIATTINTLFINLSTAVSGVLLPKMSKLVAEKASESIFTKEMIKVGRLQNFIIFLMCSGFILFGKTFIILWAGKEYEEAYWVTLLLILPISIPLIQNLGLSIMQAQNKYKFKSISTIIMAGINIIISIIFAKKWGAIGAALGTSIALVVCNIILINIYYQRVIHLNIILFWKTIIKQTIPFLGLAIIAFLLTKTIDIRNWLMLIGSGCLYVVLYSVIAYFFVMNDYEKNIINKVYKKWTLRKE